MNRSRSSYRNGRLLRLLTALGLTIAATLCGGRSSLAGWRPKPDQRFDIQLTAPFDLVRPADVVALPLSVLRLPACRSCIAAALPPFVT